MHSEHWPSEISIESVRCFQRVHTVQIRPVTLLVGENSTGKTTLLACYSLLHRMFHTDSLPSRVEEYDFNAAPFNMGSYRDIARIDPEKHESSKNFTLKLGYEHSQNIQKVITATFKEDDGQPVLTFLRMELENSFMEFDAVASDAWIGNIDGEHRRIDAHIGLLLFLLFDSGFNHFKSANLKESDVWWERAEEFGNRWIGTDMHGLRLSKPPLRLIPMAPLRASPKRTYDPVKEAYSPEGDHIPMVLMRLARTDEKAWNNLREQLNIIGRESGMFRDIQVKNIGEGMGAPFQLQVQARSSSLRNLVDVSYGVSQCLPILVDIIRANNTKFILQQPEVHLHPKAQAELATFIVKSSRDFRNRFLIETHSDYIVDRVRIGVREKLLKPADVSILYFDPNQDSVKIHNLTLDKYGNLEGRPEGYRDFFRQETDRLLFF